MPFKKVKMKKFANAAELGRLLAKLPNAAEVRVLAPDGVQLRYFYFCELEVLDRSVFEVILTD